MKYVYLVALGGCVWTTLFFTFMFVKSLLIEDGSFFVNINTYHEGWMEAVLMLVFVIISTIGLIKIFRR